MDFVSNESKRPADKMDAIVEAIFEINLMTVGHWNTIGNDDHYAVLLRRAGLSE